MVVVPVARIQMIAHRDSTDIGIVMVYDLRTILDGWEYEPGKISVRKIIGQDGREKIQTRVDLGLLQFEVAGRPDGARPNGCDSMLDYVDKRLREHVRTSGSDAGFMVTAEECRELRHEAHIFYQRYLSHFVLEEFDAVERDTARNIRLMDLCLRYADTEGDREALENQRSYTIMMHTRARVYRGLRGRQYVAALAALEDGIQQVRESTLMDEVAPDGEDGPEMQVLVALRQEVLESMPADAPPRLELELHEALEQEDYERAARIRDKLLSSHHRGDAA